MNNVQVLGGEKNVGLYISDCIISGCFAHVSFCNIRFLGWIYYITDMRRLTVGDTF